MRELRADLCRDSRDAVLYVTAFMRVFRSPSSDDASVAVMLHRARKDYRPPFELIDF